MPNQKEVVSLAREHETDMDIYTEDGCESYCEDDIISPAEQSFMIGYLDA